MFLTSDCLVLCRRQLHLFFLPPKFEGCFVHLVCLESHFGLSGELLGGRGLFNFFLCC